MEIAGPRISRILAQLKFKIWENNNPKEIIEDVLIAIGEAGFLLLDKYKLEESLAYEEKKRTNTRRIDKGYPCNLVERVSTLEVQMQNHKHHNITGIACK